MMRLQTYAGFSLVGAIAVIYHAFSSRGQFYPAMVYLSTSKISLVLLMNMGLVMMCIMWQLTKFLFLGSLREAEVERLNEQTWREVMEILFAITIFRQDFSVSFLAMVTALLLIKALHWLAQKRVEYIETTPSLPMLSHVRIVSFLGFLLVLDSLFLYSSLRYLIQTWQPSVSLFFSFEYMILATTTLATFVKYIFYVSDMLMEGQWERKAVYTFYLELIRDLLHLSMYIFFFLVIFMTYGVPLHLIRELYETFRNFKVRFADFIRYRKITSNMNDRFPDATPEELNASDVTCIICREEMVTAKKLICGHLFHVHCLRSWLERQHTCPTCRALVVPSENGAPPTGVSHGGHAEASQHVPNGAGSSSQGGGEGNAAGDNLSQHQARLEAAAAAASLYEKSYVYPSGNAFVWSPGYTILPQMYMPAASMGHGENVNPTGETSASGQAHEHQSLFPTEYSNNGLPQTSSYACAPLQMANPSSTSTERSFGDPLASGSSIEAQERFLQCQIEIFQSQLQLLRLQQKPEGSKVGVNDGVIPSTSDSKGKAVIAGSSVSDCGHHGDKEGVDTN